MRISRAPPSNGEARSGVHADRRRSLPGVRPVAHRARRRSSRR